MDHFRELRDRLVYIAGVLLVAFMVAFTYHDFLFTLLAAPIKEALAEFGIFNFRAIELTETIFVYLKLSLVAAVIGTLPFTFYQFWSFIAPGLHETERAAITPLVFFSTFFFLLGVFFAYQIIIPFIARYLAELTIASPDVAMDVTVSSAFSFSLKLMLAFGVAFELPLVMFFLSFLGLVGWRKYVKFYRFFIVLSFIIGAVFTPPDPISQLLMAVPLNILYGVGIIASFFVSKRSEAGAKSFRVPSQVWLGLAVVLGVLGLAIGGSTWWFSRSNDPLRHVPADAAWVVSVRYDTTFGKEPDKQRVAALKAMLPLSPEAPEVNHVIVASGPAGQALAIYVNACEDAIPSIGTCEGNDLLVGDADWIEAGQSADKTLMDNADVQALALTGPTWAWERAPVPSRLALLPGQQDSNLELAGLAMATDLRPDEPFVVLRVRLSDAGALTTLQNRVDLWRAEASRQREMAKAAHEGAQTQVETLKLLQQAMGLSGRRAALVKGAIIDPAALAKLDTEQKALDAQIAKRLNTLAGTVPVEPQGDSLLDRLGSAGVLSWHTSIDDDELILRILLDKSQGIDGFISLVPGALRDSTPPAAEAQ